MCLCLNRPISRRHQIFANFGYQCIFGSVHVYFSTYHRGLSTLSEQSGQMGLRMGGRVRAKDLEQGKDDMGLGLAVR